MENSPPVSIPTIDSPSYSDRIRLIIDNKLSSKDRLVVTMKYERKMKYKEISKFPSIKKDLSILVNKEIPSKEIELKIKKKAGKLLQNITVFDLYEGKNILNNKKSLAYSLTFSDSARTLQDEEINTIMENIIADLEKNGMELRK